MMKAVVVALLVLASAGVAHAYPQYQLSRDATCTSCHIAPEGGGLLNENGLAVSESISWKPGDSTFFYGVETPDWLHVGGDVRAAGGFVYPGFASAAVYPMQAEVYANAGSHGFSINLFGGLRRPQSGAPLHAFWSRQHYVMWQQHPDEGRGLYVRVGRLSPTFGLRLAEHVAYTQRFGGAPLYDEAYAVAASYVVPRFEIHATGFVHDPIATEVEHGDGGALYAEVRVTEHVAVGAEAKYASSNDQDRTYAGVTGKLYLPGPEVLLLGEAQYIHQALNTGSMDTTTQLAAYVMASKPLPSGFMLDLGAGHYTEDTRVAGTDRECVDANLHWFMTSHLEWILTTRLELIDKGSGPNGGYALAQVHYRL